MKSKKLFAILIAVVVLITSFSFTAMAMPDTTDVETVTTEIVDTAVMDVDDQDIEAMVEEYEKNMAEVAAEIAKMPLERVVAETYSVYKANEVLKIAEGMDWYGGQYIDEDGQLHVVLTDSSKSNTVLALNSKKSATMSEISKDMDFSKAPDIVVEMGKYSLKELKNVSDDFIKTVEGEQLDYILGWYIDEENNNIVMDVLKGFEEKANAIAKNYPGIVKINVTDETPMPKVTLYAGSLVWPTSSSRVTVTCFAYKGNSFGFVTVGHLLGTSIRSASNGGGSLLGTTSSSNMVRSALADGSWTAFNSGHTGKDGEARINSASPSYNFYYISGQVAPQGSTAIAYHGRSGTKPSGRITSVNSVWICAYSALNSSWSNVTCTSDIRCEFANLAGDSGSPLIGVATFGDGNPILGGLRGGGDTYSFYSKIGNIFSALNCAMVGG